MLSRPAGVMEAAINTFLPYASFEACALALDDKRLGKQRLEARQLLDALTRASYTEDSAITGWAAHPAAKMWRGHEWWLAYYGTAMCQEWIRRGFQDTMLPEFLSFTATRAKPESEPPWLGNDRLHSTMRANLVRKDPKRYRDFLGFTEQPMEGYWWPQ